MNIDFNFVVLAKQLIMENKTIFYTEKFDKHLGSCEGIIPLNIGDRFTDKEGNIYQVVWKLLNIKDMVMVYHGKNVVRTIE